MKPRHLRIGASLVPFGFLVVFFVPILYDSTLFACRNPAEACPSDPSGLESLGFRLFHWGGTYSLNTGWSDPTGGYSAPVLDSLTSFGVLLTLAFPLIVACAVLLAPEIVKVSKIARVGFVMFGAFVVSLSTLFLFSMIPTLDLLGIALAPTGVWMLVYGLRIPIFRPPE
ncbi:MAG: hypothetical protein HY296_03045 [Thaumarchaeota archaeon]|nr:hypothetical protein [Nitrososphaerota archaeon]